MCGELHRKKRNVNIKHWNHKPRKFINFLEFLLALILDEC